MPGETGSSIEGGNQENGAISPKEDDKLNRIRSQPVNIVCPTCGEIPSQGLKQYSGLSTSGYSNNIFGDVQHQIVYCCSHCAPSPRHDTGESDRHTQASSQTASSPSSTRGISRTHTLETLPSITEGVALPVSEGTNTIASNGCEIAAATGNNGGPGSGVESNSVPLIIGVKTIQKSGTEPDDWEKVYSANAESAKLDIKDAHISEEKLRSNHEYPFVPLACTWTSCVVSIEVHRGTGFRRLKIEGDDACEVWMPDSRVQVFPDHTTIRLRFSNCNKLQPPGYYRSQDGTPMSVTTYHPEKPNVSFEVGFSDDTVAGTFSDHILRRGVINETSEDALIQQSSQTTISHGTYSTGSQEQRSCVLVWEQGIDAETDTTTEVHDIVAVSPKFDLDVKVSGQEANIVIGYVDRLTYYPAFDEPDLPQNVKRTLDGAPASSSIEGGHVSTSTLRLTTTPTDAKQLVNHVLSRTLSWRLEAIFHQVDVKMSSSKKLKLGSNSYTAQLTLWLEPNNHTIRISIRASDASDSERKSEKQEIQWFSVALAEGEGQPTAGLKQNTLTFKKIDCEDGKCLSTNDLRPIDADSENDTSKNGNNSSSIALELKFGDADQVRQFREVATDQYLRVDDS